MLRINDVTAGRNSLAAVDNDAAARPAKREPATIRTSSVRICLFVKGTLGIEASEAFEIVYQRPLVLSSDHFAGFSSAGGGPADPARVRNATDPESSGSGAGNAA